MTRLASQPISFALVASFIAAAVVVVGLFDHVPGMVMP